MSKTTLEARKSLAVGLTAAAALAVTVIYAKFAFRDAPVLAEKLDMDEEDVIKYYLVLEVGVVVLLSSAAFGGWIFTKLVDREFASGIMDASSRNVLEINVIIASTLILVARSYAVLAGHYYAWENLLPLGLAAGTLLRVIQLKIKYRDLA